MRHPLLDVELPEVLDRLAAYVATRGRERAERALGGVDLDAWLVSRAGDAGDDRLLSEAAPPFELVPFGHQSEVYFGLVVHTVEHAPVAASWARGEEACWLGDHAEQALAHLLGVAVRDAALHLADDEDAAEVVRDARASAEELAAALEIPIATDLDALSEGARTELPADAPAPEGWIFEPCNDGIGVLAPASAFDPELVAAQDGAVFDLAEELSRADDLLARGFFGSALAEARNTALGVARHPEHLLAVRRMRAAYDALGRDFLVRRVDAYLARRP